MESAQPVTPQSFLRLLHVIPLFRPFPTPRQPLICFLELEINLPVLGFCINDIIWYVVSQAWASFTQHNFCEAHRGVPLPEDGSLATSHRCTGPLGKCTHPWLETQGSCSPFPGSCPQLPHLYFPGVAGASVKLLQGDTGQGSKPLKVCIPQLEQR